MLLPHFISPFVCSGLFSLSLSLHLVPPFNRCKLILCVCSSKPDRQTGDGCPPLVQLQPLFVLSHTHRIASSFSVASSSASLLVKGTRNRKRAKQTRIVARPRPEQPPLYRRASAVVAVVPFTAGPDFSSVAEGGSTSLFLVRPEDRERKRERTVRRSRSVGQALFVCTCAGHLTCLKSLYKS